MYHVSYFFHLVTNLTDHWDPEMRDNASAVPTGRLMDNFVCARNLASWKPQLYRKAWGEAVNMCCSISFCDSKDMENRRYRHWRHRFVMLCFHEDSWRGFRIFRIGLWLPSFEIVFRQM